jgi:hypothetical protein
MRAPGTAFEAAVDAIRAHHDPQHEDDFFDRIRLCKNVPPARHPGDYTEFAESLLRAWLMANVLSLQVAIERRMRAQANAILWRAALRGEVGEKILDRLFGSRERESGEILDLEWIDDPDSGLPPRRDHITAAKLGHWRCLRPALFVREAGLAMRGIFGRPYKPYDEIVGELAGLAFNIETLPPATVRSMRRKDGSASIVKRQ